MTIMRKGDFARMINVTPGRISQYIKARQIDGDAIVGAGPRAMIDAPKALQQLRLRLDDNQRASLNGLNTRLDGAPAARVRAAYVSRAIVMPAGDDDDGLAEVERHRGVMVDLADVESAVDEIRVLQDFEIQDALKPHPEALAAYVALRPQLAAIGRRD
jgi:hypothetical protein